MFSEMENQILKVLGKKALMIAEITEKCYPKKNKPINANNTVAGTIRRINMKCKAHNLKWKIEGYGTGRGGRIVWIKEI